ncbi:MAG: hypothetical protein WDZ41_04745 [Candidatus Babeliales bacterium]
MKRFISLLLFIFSSHVGLQAVDNYIFVNPNSLTISAEIFKVKKADKTRISKVYDKDIAYNQSITMHAKDASECFLVIISLTKVGKKETKQSFVCEGPGTYHIKMNGMQKLTFEKK